MLTYKFRLYKTETQVKIMNETLETCRILYNELLADRIENKTGFYEQKKMLVELKKKNSNKYLTQVYSQVSQDVVLRLDKAYQAFFTGLSRYPKFRRRGRYNSFSYPQSGFKLSLEDSRIIKLSMIGDVKVRIHRQVDGGAIKRVIVIRDIDQWFVALLVDEEDCVGELSSGDCGKVGVDVGVSNIVALSDGTLIDNPRFLNRSAERIESLQRQLSRKKHGSSNRRKTKLSLAKAWRKVRRQRDDFAHKLSDGLAKENQIIVLEDLRIGNMVKNHNLASAIMDSTWGKLRQLTAYKAERRGGRVILVNPCGTSQKCSRCGNIEHLKLSDRVFRCSACGIILDRDVNAARNILNLGLEQAHAETEPIPVTAVRRISKFSQGSRKPTAFRRG